MISKLCVNTGSVSVGRRKWRPFIEFYLCISESIVIYNTYINVHIYPLDAYIEVCESASKTSVQKNSQYIFDIQDTFLSTFVGILKMQGVDCKTFVFFLFNVLKRDTVMVLFLDIAILNLKMYQQMEEKPQNTLGSHWQAVRTEMCGGGI